MITLPDAKNAKLPRTYESAKTALAECSRIDECAEWANRAEALASYARQAGDETLRKTADRIQARAIQRCGELLKAIKPASGSHRKSGGAPTFSRRQAAQSAGLSKDQQVTATRVASVPKAEFEAAVESASPPTVTALADRGRKRHRRPQVKPKTHFEQALAEAREWMRRWSHLSALSPIFSEIIKLSEERAT